MSKYINATELLTKISKEQEKLISNDDEVWERNKPYYKAYAYVHAMIRECTDILDINKTSITLNDEVRIEWERVSEAE